MEHQLSDQQLAFMRVLWEYGEASVGDVKKGLADAGCELAPTSVATVLSRLAKKGLVEHRTSGRHFVYRALVSENEVRRSVLQRVTQGLFAGDVTALVSSLLETEKVSNSELEEVKRMILAREGTQDGEEC